MHASRSTTNLNSSWSSFVYLGLASLTFGFAPGCGGDDVGLMDAGTDAQPTGCCVATPGGDQMLCDEAEPHGQTRCEMVGGGDQCNWVAGPACEGQDAGSGSDGGSGDGGSGDGGEPSCCAAYDPTDSALCAGFGPADCEAKSECHPVIDDACHTCCTSADPASVSACASLSYDQCIVTRPCVVASGAECAPTEPSCCLAERPEDASVCAPLSPAECEAEAPRCYPSSAPECTSSSCCRGISPRFDAECNGLSDTRCEALDQCVVASGADCVR